MENKKNCWFLLTLNRDLFSNVIMNLYITNDDSITENDYYINSLDNAIRKGSLYNHPYHHKIILTTDINLIENGVQAIEDKFLQLFCSKNGKVDFVDVKTEKVINYSFPRSVYDKYIITVPDEKPFSNLKKESFELPFPQLLKEFSNYYIGYDPIEDSEQDTETIEKLHKYKDTLIESMKVIETQTRYTKQDIIEFAKWIATPELHGYGKQLYEAKTRHKVDKLEDLIDIWLKQNNKNMEEEQNKLYDIHLQLSYGELLIEGIEAGSEEEAIDIAIEKATNELSYAKTSVLRKRDKI